MCHYRGREYKGPSDAAQLAPEDALARFHDSLEHKSLGHTRWPGWRPLLETSTEPRRQQREQEHCLGAFQHNCESLLALDRLYELMALAEREGATIACLQGTLFDGVSEWVNHGYRCFSLNRSGPRQKDGCMIAISTNICSHSDQMCAPLDAESNFWPQVEVWRGSLCGRCFRHQCMMREHEQRHPSLSEMNSGENGRSHLSHPRLMPSDSVYGRQR